MDLLSLEIFKEDKIKNYDFVIIFQKIYFRKYFDIFCKVDYLYTFLIKSFIIWYMFKRNICYIYQKILYEFYQEIVFEF